LNKKALASSRNGAVNIKCNFRIIDNLKFHFHNELIQRGDKRKT